MNLTIRELEEILMYLENAGADRDLIDRVTSILDVMSGEYKMAVES